MVVVNTTAAVAGESPASVAVGDGEARNGHGFTRTNVEHSTLGVAVDSQIFSAWS